MSDNSVPLALMKKSFLAAIEKKVYAPAIVAAPASGAAKVSFLRGLLPKSPREAQDENAEPRYRPVRSMTLSIAGWVTLPEEIRSAISLLLVYQDGETSRAVVVDEMNARGASQIMLSGEVEIAANKSIDSLTLYCGGIDDSRVWVEDLHVRRVDSPRESVSLAS